MDELLVAIMIDASNILIVQTAFPGDVVLTLPMIQVLQRNFPSATIDMLVIPRTAELLTNHPAIHEAVIYDKHDKDSGLSGFIELIKKIRQKKYDIAFIPHRSMRSALLVRFGGIPKRIGFDKSAGSFFFTDVVRYQETHHEIDRNVSLLKAIGIVLNDCELPQLYPGFSDRRCVELLLFEFGIQDGNALIGVAPGSVWNTKRWLKDRFAELIRKLTVNGYQVILFGGIEDAQLCEEILHTSSSKQVHSAAGKLTLLQSAELIRRCRVLVSNDSAPMHLAAAMKTPVAAIFGATIPEFGFAPYGENDVTIEIEGLACRPCSIHGGNSCPISTFDCMNKITSENVFEKVSALLELPLFVHNEIK